jgi:hypothetical protein
VSARCKAFVKGMSGKSIWRDAWREPRSRGCDLIVASSEDRSRRTLSEVATRGAGKPSCRRFPQAGGSLTVGLGACLFFSHVPDYRQLEHLALIGFEQKNDPEGKPSQSNEQVKRNQDQSDEWDKGEN